MAFCPNCSRRVPLTTILQLEPEGEYHCRWCRTTSILDSRRFHFASYATAVLFVLLPLMAYFFFRSLGAAAAVLLIWVFLSPFAYEEWVSLRLTEQAAPRLNEVPPPRPSEEAPQEERAV